MMYATLRCNTVNSMFVCSRLRLCLRPWARDDLLQLSISWQCGKTDGETHQQINEHKEYDENAPLLADSNPVPDMLRRASITIPTPHEVAACSHIWLTGICKVLPSLALHHHRTDLQRTTRNVPSAHPCLLVATCCISFEVSENQSRRNVKRFWFCQVSSINSVRHSFDEEIKWYVGFEMV